MAINLSDSIRVGQQKPTDDRYYNGLVPFTSIAEANAANLIGVRYRGMTVNINGDEYWYKDGIADGDLVLKIASGPIGPAGGDLSGTYPNPTVAKFNGQLPSYYLDFTNLTNKPTIEDILTIGDDAGGLSIFNLGNVNASEVYAAGNIYANYSELVATQNWVTAQGYLTSFTETDPTVGSHIKAISTTDISNWNTAFGWGNHAGLYPLLTNSYTNPSWISSLPWSKITGTPSTLAGYGISDGVHSISGTTNRIVVIGGGTNTPQIDIASNYAGQTSITNLGTITIGTWNGTVITDTFIASAATWNAKENALTFSTGLSRVGDTIISTITQYTDAQARAALSFVAGSGGYNSTTGVITIPTNTNQLTNDAGFITTISGIAAGGELSGTYPNPSLVNSAVVGKILSGVNITGGTITDTDSILTAFGKVQNQINSLIGGMQFVDFWNASTNTPTIPTAVGNKGKYYIVQVAGSTSISGITDWQVGDWIVSNGTTWSKIDNTDAVVSVNGQTGVVSLTSSHITEGSNLYYTDSRSRAALSFVAGTGSYNSTTGVITIPTHTSHLTNNSGFITDSTSGLVNYYTKTEIQNYFSGASGMGGYNKSNWDTAYGWGNHATYGYLLSSTAASTYVALSGSYTNPTWITSLAWSKITGAPAFITSETDPVFTASVAYDISTADIGNWNTACSWGNHASAGYLTTSLAASTYQPLDGDLTSIAALSGTSGLLRKTAANTWSLDNNTYALESALNGYVTTYTTQTITGAKTFVGGLFGTYGSFTGNFNFGSVSITGGTSSQFLKADGSVDANTYLTDSYTGFDSRYLQLAGGTMSGLITMAEGVGLKSATTDGGIFASSGTIYLGKHSSFKGVQINTSTGLTTVSDGLNVQGVIRAANDNIQLTPSKRIGAGYDFGNSGEVGSGYIEFYNTGTGATTLMNTTSVAPLILGTNNTAQLTITSAGAANFSGEVTTPSIVSNTYKNSAGTTQLTFNPSTNYITFSGNGLWSNNLVIGETLEINGFFYHRSNLNVLNKAVNGWLTWATRNTSGSEAKIDLSNIGTITASGQIVAGGNLSVSNGYFGGNLFINSNAEVVYDTDQDSFAWTLSDYNNDFGFGMGAQIHATANPAYGHHFITGDGLYYAPIKAASYVVNGKDATDVLVGNGATKKAAELIVPAVRVNDADYTATIQNEFIEFYNLTDNRQLTLPNPASMSGKKLVVILRNNSEKVSYVGSYIPIDLSGSTITILAAASSNTLYSNGVNWIITESYFVPL